MLTVLTNLSNDMTIYQTNYPSNGKPFYPGSDKFWVEFSSDVSVELAGSREFSNYTVFLYRRCYIFETIEFKEYEFQYFMNSQSGTVEVSRQDIKKMLRYNIDFERMLK